MNSRINLRAANCFCEPAQAAGHELLGFAISRANFGIVFALSHRIADVPEAQRTAVICVRWDLQTPVPFQHTECN